MLKWFKKTKPNTPKSFDQLIDQGNNALAAEDFQAALSSFDSAVGMATTPTERVTAIFSRGRVYSRLGNYDAARTDFNTVTQIAPAFPLSYFERGVCELMQNESRSAIDDFDRAIVLLPPGQDLINAYGNRSTAFERLGDFKAALADVERIVELAPNFQPGLQKKERLRHVIAKNPASHSVHATETVETLCQSGWSRSNEGNLVDALVQFTRAVEKDEYNPNAYYGRGVANAKLRRYPQAMDDLNQALALDAQFPAALTERGLIHVEKTNYRAGLADYNQALSIDPDYGIAYINRGALHALQQAWTDAVRDLTKGIELNGITFEALGNRAQAYEQLGQIHEAIEDWQRFLEAYPNAPQVSEIRHRVAALKTRL